MPICSDCREEMVKARHENEEGDWIVMWLCGCQAKVERKPNESGKWWLFVDTIPIRELSDGEVAYEIWEASPIG